jgi:hypothetical protein
MLPVPASAKTSQAAVLASKSSYGLAGVLRVRARGLSGVVVGRPRERGPAGASGRGGYGVPSRSGGEVERQRAETNDLEHPVWSPCGLASEEGRDPSWLGVPVSRGNPLGRCVTTRADLLTSPSHLSH